MKINKNQSIVISIGHITSSDNKIFSAIQKIVMDNEVESDNLYKFITEINKDCITLSIDSSLSENGFIERLNAVYSSGFSINMVGVYFWAYNNNYNSVSLCWDGEIIKELPSFDW